MQDESFDLRPGEFVIDDLEERLWRQVNPAFVHDGRVTSQAFSPTPKDSGELSTSRRSVVGAEAAYTHHTVVLGYSSVGVYSVDVREVVEEQLRVIDDSAVDDGESRPPGHAFVDFRSIASIKGHRKIAAKLRDKAEQRGWEYRPEQ